MIINRDPGILTPLKQYDEDNNYDSLKAKLLGLVKGDDWTTGQGLN